MYYLGVDGGGTKTSAVLLDTASGTTRSARLGSGNLCVLGRSGCMQLLEDLHKRLFEDLHPSDINGAAFAFAGAGRAAERTMLESVLAEQGYQRFEVMTDAEILHFSCFGNSPGILVEAGTGSVCLVVSPDGETVQIGGWGYILGDEGGGFHIGKCAIAQILKGAETQQALTGFGRMLLDHYQVDAPKKLITLVYASERPQSLIASCAATVDEYAQRGDPDAVAVIRVAAQALAKLTQNGIDIYQKANSEHIQIALAGGLLKPGSSMVQTFRELMDEYPAQIEYRKPQYAPAEAAALHAAARCDDMMPLNTNKPL